MPQIYTICYACDMGDGKAVIGVNKEINIERCIQVFLEASFMILTKRNDFDSFKLKDKKIIKTIEVSEKIDFGKIKHGIFVFLVGKNVYYNTYYNDDIKYPELLNDYAILMKHMSEKYAAYMKDARKELSSYINTSYILFNKEGSEFKN